MSTMKDKGKKIVCRCRPICKNRRREWKGVVLKTSDELFVERRPTNDCRKTPLKDRVEGTCPLRDVTGPVRAFVICSAPLDDQVETPYLRYMELAKKLGALAMVRARCPWYTCRSCSLTSSYEFREPGRPSEDMRALDLRVDPDPNPMKIMYNLPQKEYKRNVEF